MSKGILVVDVGTSKVHVNLIDIEDGMLLDNVAYPYPWVHPAEGWSEVDANLIWEAAEKAVGDVYAHTKQEHEIRAIGFSYIGDSLIAVDGDNTPLGNLILAMDGRAGEEAGEINLAFGQSLYEKIGMETLWPFSIPAKVLWLKKNKPEYFSKAKYFLNIQQFLNMKLGFDPITDYSMAGRKEFLNYHTMRWSEELCEFIGFPVEKLGDQIAYADAVFGRIKNFGKVEFEKEIPVVLGAHDSECGMIGLGVLPGEKTTLGNVSGTYDHIGYLLKENPGKLEGFFGVNCGPVEGSFVLMGANITGPSVDWFANNFYPEERSRSIGRLFKECDFDGLNKVFLTRGIHTGDGCIRGINLTTTPEDLFKAFIEGLTFPLKDFVDRLAKFNGQNFNTIRIGGGLARSDEWSQLRADMFGIPVEKVRNIEISSQGAAVMAAVSTKSYPTYEQAREKMVGIDKVFEPDAEKNKRYGQRYSEYLTKIDLA